MSESIAYQIALASQQAALTALDALEAGVPVERVHQDRYVATAKRRLAKLEQLAGLHADSTEPDSRLAITEPLTMPL